MIIKKWNLLLLKKILYMHVLYHYYSFNDNRITMIFLFLLPQFNEHFFKKLPPGSEASNILVGEVEQLETPIMAFVRLKRSVLLGDLTEVPIPTR